MIAPLAKFIDWSSLQTAYMFLPRTTDERNPRLEEAIQLLNSSDFVPTESQPAKIEFDNLLDFHFSTPRPAETVVTSGRKLRAHSFLSYAALVMRMVLRGSSGLRNRRGLDYWYEPEREKTK